MNSHLNYLMAAQRTSELMRTAQNARQTNDAQATPQAERRRPPARTVLRVRLRNAAAGRLRVRRA